MITSLNLLTFTKLITLKDSLRKVLVNAMHKNMYFSISHSKYFSKDIYMHLHKYSKAHKTDTYETILWTTSLKLRARRLLLVILQV